MSVWNAFRHPVSAETRAHLARLWSELPPSLRDERQMHGRQTEGCAATIGVMPRCDFACRGCYLGADANRMAPRPVAEIRAQLATIRRHVGRFGNVQLTDGEVTLRAPAELVELLCAARELELVPMLMTHGDALRRDPGLLERLVVEGGLREISFHVDTTQRGREGAAYRAAWSEAELDPLRDELAELVRATRRRTGLPLRAAGTVTVTRANLEGVPGIVRRFLAHADAFRILAFLPAAPVGRTEEGLGAPSREELWERIARGAAGDAVPGEDRSLERSLERGRLVFGHPDCSRVVMGLVHARAGEEPRYHPLRRLDDPGRGADERFVRGFYHRWGGISFRADRRGEALARGLGMLVRTPGFLLGGGLPYLWRWARRLAPDAPARFAGRALAGRDRIHGLALVSHHFMSRAELATPRGAERAEACTFRVPLDGRMVSMCEVNATGLRDRYHAGFQADS